MIRLHDFGAYIYIGPYIIIYFKFYKKWIRNGYVCHSKCHAFPNTLWFKGPTAVMEMLIGNDKYIIYIHTLCQPGVR